MRIASRTISSRWLSLLLLLLLSPLEGLSTTQRHHINHRSRRRRAQDACTQTNRRGKWRGGANWGNLNPGENRITSGSLRMTLYNDYERIDHSDEDSFFRNPDADVGSSKRKLIEISSAIELPFSAEVAYRAYSNLPRQPSWSSWLESVVVLNDSNNEEKTVSRWTSKIMGFRYSWTAEAVSNVRPHTICWRSVTGLRNEGIVRFYRRKGKTYDEGPTLMTLRMTFVAPRAVTAIMRRSKKLSQFVEEKMISQSLMKFRDIVLEQDALNEVESESKPSTL